VAMAAAAGQMTIPGWTTSASDGSPPGPAWHV
jgi:hypothetical protein